MIKTTSDLNKPQWARKLLTLTLTVSLLFTVWSLSSYLWDKYRVVRDVQNFYWMARAQDPDLFARDYLYISSDQVIPVDLLDFHLLLYPLSFGYGLFFYLASTVLDYVWLTKLSVLVLVPLSVIYLFKLGQRLEDNLTGLSLSLIFMFFILASPTSTSMVSGLQRAFAIPLFIAFLYHLICRQYLGAGLMMFLSALIYLPNFPPMVIAYVMSLIAFERPFKFSFRITRTSLLPFVGTLLLSGVFVGLALAVQLGWISAPSSPPPVTVNANEPVPVSENPHYQAEGASEQLFIGFPFLGRAGIFDTGGDVANFLVMMIFAGLIYKIVGPQSLRRMPKEAWYLLVAGLIMYAAALFFLFGLSSFALYLPSRYGRSALFLTGLLFVGLNWVDFLHKFPDWLLRNARLLIFFFVSFGLALLAVYLFSSNRPLIIPTVWFIGLILSGILALLGGSSLFWLAVNNFPMKNAMRWGGLLILGVIVVWLGTIYINILGVKTTNPSRAERDIYEFVATLPKETVLAGDPALMTNIPLFSRRSVLFRDLFPTTNAPIVQYFDAQYAETPQSMLDFCQRYQVHYLALNRTKFSPDYLAKGNFFFQPWNDKIVEIVVGRSNFALLQLEPVFASGPFMVIKCDTETMLADGSK
jgi:hypothetical protein